MTATDTAVGIVVEPSNPVPDAFRINPAGDVIEITLPDDGSGNLYYFWDTNNPGKLTQTPPTGGVTRAIPMFLKLDTNRAIHFDGANVNDQTDQFVTLGSTQTITATKTFDANQTFAQDITVQGSAQIDTNLTVTGDFTVNGTTTTVNTTNTTITDQLIELNHGYTGPPMSNDSGIVINRGPEDNLFIGWDEDQNEFTAGTGTFDGTTTGAITTNDANVRFGNIKSSTLTDNRILIAGAGGIIEDDTNLTWNGDELGVTGTKAVFTTGKVNVGTQLTANVEHTMSVMYGVTADATVTSLEIAAGVTELTITDNTTVHFEATIVGRNNLGTKHCSYKISGVIDKTGGNASLVNTVTETIIAETDESWIGQVTTLGNNLAVQVTGEAATNIRWVAFVKTTSISF